MFAAQRISYNQTNAFSPIILDYLNGAEDLQPFYSEVPDEKAFVKAIANKKDQTIDREALVHVLKEQYASVNQNDIKANIDLLLSPDTFTICTAHQPNLFTGPLYFIYKILHAIKLSENLKHQLPQYNFVPVFYMGSEDADLAELNHFTIEGKKYEWKTAQTGAVGRMIIDKALTDLIEELNGQLAVQPHGNEWIRLLKAFYKTGITIQEATFQLVHHLFGKYGLVVLIADHALLKKLMVPVFENDLFAHQPSHIVKSTSEKLSVIYKSQAHAREINLFYLKDNVRERIEQQGIEFVVCHTDIKFTAEELIKELKEHPEHFSPNVILRGLFQETILPNVAFIGGGGEVAYWLQLKDLFQQFSIPFPLLVLRNSFLIIENKWAERINHLGLKTIDLFKDADAILNDQVKKKTDQQLTLNGKMEKALSLYASIQEQATSIDPTLAQHVVALQKQALQKLEQLEKKMLRAEKRKFKDSQQQINALKQALFPRNGLQERVENIGFYYAKWGINIIEELYNHSLGLEQEFTVLVESKS